MESKSGFSTQQEAKLDSAIFEKLNVRKISDILLEHENQEDVTKFSDLYEYKKCLGKGSFGLVIQAVEKKT